MFVTYNQLYVFLACFSFGVFCGVVYSPITFFKSLIKIKAIQILIDVLFFTTVSFFYVLLSYKLKFPSLRFYMVFGVFSGLFSYMKSFHIILANFNKKLYNIIKKNKGKRRWKKRSLKEE